MDIKPPTRRPIKPVTSNPVPLLPLPEQLPELPLIAESHPENADFLGRKPKSKKIWTWIWLSILLGTIFLGTLVAFGWYNLNLQSIDGEERHARVTIESGTTADAIANQLFEAKVIRSPLAFRLYVQLNGKKAALQAGKYAFSSKSSTPEIVDKLVEGKVEAYNITILPGKTLAQIKEGLIKDGFSSNEVDQAFAKTYEHPLLSTKPTAVSLEGYIYPETYQVDASTSVEQLLTRSFDEFYKQIEQKGLISKIATHNLNLHQAITLASIIEMEVSKPNDRSIVAQVFLSRLATGMKLESDVTFMYAAKLLGVEPSVDLDSPYNTRKYSGLPPGAIANMNVGVLENVANPASTDYLYFVAGDDGNTYFSHTFEEHEQNVASYCHKLCQ